MYVCVILLFLGAVFIVYFCGSHTHAWLLNPFYTDACRIFSLLTHARDKHHHHLSLALSVSAPLVVEYEKR